MKQLILALSMTALLNGCAGEARNIDRVQAGMSPEQVSAIICPPDTASHSPGKECAYYTLLKDFWSRVPWSMADHFYVCFDGGKAESFGTVADAGSG